MIHSDGTYEIVGETSGTWTKSGNQYELTSASGFRDELTLSPDKNLLSGVGYRIKKPSSSWKMKCKRKIAK